MIKPIAGLLLSLGLMLPACSKEQDVGAPKSVKALAISPSNPDLAWGPCPSIFPAGCEIAVLNGDPGAPNADIFLRIAPGAILSPHTHTSAERMILSAGELTVTYAGQSPTTLRAGDYAFGPAELPHEATCISAASCVLFIAFESAVDALPYEGDL
jgi:quercetin dioxygenase-like cupin family protein